MKLYYIKVSLSLAIASFAVAGCLKDQPYDDREVQSTRPDGSARVIELKISANNTRNFVSHAYDNSNTDTVVDLVPINLATADVAGEDIKVTLEIKPELVDAYNTTNHTGYSVPPSSLVTILNPVVTIPKGSRTGYMQVKFKPSSIIGQELAYGFAITSIDRPGYNISGNMGTGVVAILIKNKYDGIYEVDGTLVDAINPALSSGPDGPYPFEVELRTTGANSVAMWASGIDYGHFIGGNSYYGSFSPNFIIDPATNKITAVTNYHGQPSGNNRSAELDPAGANMLNADKSFDVKYVMKQAGATRTTFDEHFRYIGPR
jgi:hypothetical protein